jgi:hypothetical protein
MKQFDSYIIYGCHFSENNYKMIIKNTNLNNFNSIICSQYNCKIYEFNVPISDNKEKKKYFLGINLEQSDTSILTLENLEKINKIGFYKMLETFSIDKKDPYLISIPIIRHL